MLAVGCASKSQSPNNSLEQIKLTEELQISANSAEALAGDFSGLAVDARGDIYAADSRLMKIHLFSPEGEYIDSLGREGEGPGEFNWLDSQIKIQSDTLFALDRRNWRITMFSLADQVLAGTIDVPKSKVNGADLGSPKEILPRPNGDIMVLYVKPHLKDPKETGATRKTTVSVIDKSGKFVEKDFLQFDTLFPTDQKLIHMDGASMSVFTAPFYPDYETAIDRQGHLYIGTSDSLLLRGYDHAGRLTDTLTGSFQGPFLDQADIDSISDEKGELFSKVVQKVGSPTHWPAFQHILLDGANRAWIQLVDPGKQQQRWIVFSEDGKPGWEFALPTHVKLYAVQKGKAYGISQIPEELPTIIRYNIAMD
nr:6-bladed beta-propeller [Fodinibius salsisoli]